MKQRQLLTAALLFAAACIKMPPPVASPDETSTTPSSSTSTASTVQATPRAVLPDIPKRLAQLPATVIDYDRALLDANETAVVGKLIEASKLIDEIYWRQVAEESVMVRDELAEQAKTDPKAMDAYRYLWVMKGRWDRLAQDEPFVSPFGAEGRKPKGAGFYPKDMTKEELDSWIVAHPGDKEAFQGLNSVIRRQNGKLVAVPYSKAYADLLTPAAAKLREAAQMTGNASLRDFLSKRADAFLSDDYYASDFAWMDLSSPIEIVIGPYEVYEDELFNYKAAFESFVCVVDEPESRKLAVYAKHLPAMEKNLPMPDEHKNTTRGSDSPIRVVQEIFTAGDARRGVQTSAFNLPNDERVREAKGSKKVLLKNVMDAKYRMSGHPIALRVLETSQQGQLSFDAYFNHVLFHELAHGLGPGIITSPDGRKVENRLLLETTYSPIEECKADVTGLWSLLYALDQKLVTSFNREQLFTTYAGLMFRSMRFGIDAAHGRGNAVQWNWFREKNAIVPVTGGRYRVDMTKVDDAIRTLAEELLMIEATGDKARAERLLDKYGVETAEIREVISRLTDIPVDITPVFPAAGEGAK